MIQQNALDNLERSVQERENQIRGQPTLQNKDEVEVRRIGKKIIVTKKETKQK